MRQHVVRWWFASAALVFVLGQSARAFAATPDIVLYTSDVTTMRGNWVATSGAGAGDQYLAGADSGSSTIQSPSAAPTDYFEMTFNADANTPYHVWLRLRASANSKYNDSVWVQFG